MRARDVDVGLRRHPDVADRVRAADLLEPVLARDRLRVAEVLDDFERVAERENLTVGDVLDEVGERLQLAVIVQRDAERVVRLLLDVLHLRAEPQQSLLDQRAMPAQTIVEFEVPRRVRVGELEPHDDQIVRLSVERVAGGVGAAMLHRLEHPRHVESDVVLSAVLAVDDPRDPAHQGRTSRYFSRSQSVTAARNCSHSSRL